MTAFKRASSKVLCQAKRINSTKSKYRNRYKPEVQLSKEEEKAWRKDQLRQRNREASARLRERKKEELKRLKLEVEDWKRKCHNLIKSMNLPEMSTLASKDKDIPSLIAVTNSEEHTSSTATSKAKIIKPDQSKYRNEYKPPVPMSKEQEKKWRTLQREQRNREAAAESQFKKKEELNRLKQEVNHWKGKHDCLVKRKKPLEKRSTLTSKAAKNDVASLVSSANEEHNDFCSNKAVPFTDQNKQQSASFTRMQDDCPSPKSSDFRTDGQCDTDGDMQMARLRKTLNGNNVLKQFPLPSTCSAPQLRKTMNRGNGSKRLFSILSVRFLKNEKCGKGINMRLPQLTKTKSRYAWGLMNDEKLDSFTVRHEDQCLSMRFSTSIFS